MKKMALLFCLTLCCLLTNAQPFDQRIFRNSKDLLMQADTISSTVNDINIPMSDSNNIAPYGLVAGGSKGIGFAIAEALARRGYNLILIARHMDGLLEAKHKIETAYRVNVEVLSYDLSKEETAPAIAVWCNERNIRLTMLCNVAGLGGDEDYLKLPLDSLRYMVRLNVESAMSLSLTLLPLLEKNAPSHILNVASMAGFAPIPAKNLYAATKSAVVSFSYSLRYQLRTKNISVSCLTPGPVYTKPSIEKETKRQLGWFGDAMSVKPARVGEVTVKKTLKGRPIIVPGTLAKILSGVLRILPKRFVTYVYGKAGDRSDRKHPK
ncbi:MAG: SDR family NAD(P)-dependent oxidoreductase [Ferruginibacter sp.]